MRRILINRAQEKGCLKRGGGWKRIDLDGLAVVDDASDEDLIAIDEALGRLAEASPPCAELIKLRFFAGLTLDEAAVSLGLAPRTADRYWAYSRARLYEMLSAVGVGLRPGSRYGTAEAQEEFRVLAKGAPEARLTQEAKTALERLATLARSRH
jgi:hypothetical protein